MKHVALMVTLFVSLAGLTQASNNLADPTAGKWTTSAYVPVAVAANPWDAGPLHGSFSVAPPTPGVFAKSTLTFGITVQRLDPPQP